MPGYEMSVIYKALERPELQKAIRRTLDAILERGGIIKSLENVGLRKLPHKMFKHNMVNLHGNYYLVKFYGKPSIVTDLNTVLGLDLEVIKRSILREEEMVSRPCDHRDCDFGEMNVENRERLKNDIKNFIKKL